MHTPKEELPDPSSDNGIILVFTQNLGYESRIQTIDPDIYHEFITLGVNSKYTFSNLLYIGHTATPGALYIRAGACIRAKITSTCIP